MTPALIHRAPQRGFTLLELIVALALSSLVALVGTAGLSMASDFYARHQARSPAREGVRAAERILQHEWQGRGLRVYADASLLEFDTVHPWQLPAPSRSRTSAPDMPPLPLARVRYRCEPVADSKAWALVYQVQALPPAAPPGAPVARGPTPTPEAEGQRWVLAAPLQVCAFSFLLQGLDAQGKPQPRWVASWDASQPPPRLMRLALSGLHADAPPVVYSAHRDGAR